jgi:hypothetical protein
VWFYAILPQRKTALTQLLLWLCLPEALVDAFQECRPFTNPYMMQQSLDELPQQASALLTQ